MIICVDTVRTMYSALIVDAICRVIATRTLVSSASHVLGNSHRHARVSEISWTRLVYRQRAVQSRLIALSSRILELYRRSSKTISVTTVPFACTSVSMPSSRERSKADCYKEFRPFFKCRSRYRLHTTTRPTICRRRSFCTGRSLELSRQRLCIGASYQVCTLYF